MTNTANEIELKEQKVFELLTNTLGYKILIRNYECPLGEISFIAKKESNLVFIGIDKPLDKLNATAKYYIKRYGIKDVQFRVVEL